MGGASVLAAVANEAWEQDVGGWRLTMRVGLELTAITFVIYAIGWGPTLVVGLVFGVADCMRSVGAAATRPAIVLSIGLIGLGQAGIAVGSSRPWSPSPWYRHWPCWPWSAWSSASS